jgi:hypothetical protein
MGEKAYADVAVRYHPMKRAAELEYAESDCTELRRHANLGSGEAASGRSLNIVFAMGCAQFRAFSSGSIGCS